MSDPVSLLTLFPPFSGQPVIAEKTANVVFMSQNDNFTVEVITKHARKARLYVIVYVITLLHFLPRLITPASHLSAPFAMLEDIFIG